jgi:hypothetical protein
MGQRIDDEIELENLREKARKYDRLMALLNGKWPEEK